MRNWLKELRKQAGLTQQQVADLAGVSQGFYGNIELGKRGHKLPVETAKRIAEVLEFDWQRFYTAEERDALTPRSAGHII